MGRTIEVSLNFLANTRLLERTSLLVENAKSDGQFYTYLLDALRPLFKAPRLSFDLIHGGGGDDIPSVFGIELKNGKALCCIVDSDFGFPSSPKSSKFHKISTAVKDADWKFAVVMVLPCREVENLIPISVIHSLQCATERRATVKMLLAIELHEQRSGISPNEAFWLYFDAKHGLTFEGIEKLPEAERDWIFASLRNPASRRDSSRCQGLG